MTTADILPVTSTLGGGFLAGALAGCALKKVMKCSRNLWYVYCCDSVS
ncbi:MAG: hypothetical protein WA667_06055 [Candidatus Nitrosopolaris sp.]